MMLLAEAARLMGGVVPDRHGTRRITGVTIDSRGVAPGELFVALPGERVDGHAFVAAALEAGAAGALVRAGVDLGAAAGGACIAVRDPRLALGQLARAWRARHALPLVAVVGSNGKTTVTQMIAAVLREYAGANAFHTTGNLNNDIGLPLTLLRLRPHHTAGVIELGMNHPGEIGYLAGIARPTIALVNNAQREHQEFMRSVAEVAAENGSVFHFLPHDGVAIVNADDGCAEVFRDLAGGRRLMTFGLEHPADITARCGEATFGHHLLLADGDMIHDVPLRAPGRHNALNALAATAAARALGIPLATIARGLAGFTPVAGRLVKSLTPRGAVVLDDSYNANPDSVRAAVDVLAGIPGQRVLVLVRMGEVGDQGPAFHREVGAYAAQRGIHALVTMGPEAAEAAAAFGPGAQACADVDAATAAAAALAAPGTTVLVKGSRSARMERVVRALLGKDAGPAEAH